MDENRDSHPQIYNSIGKNYSDFRVPDPRLQAAIFKALGSAENVCNIGAGTGAYEPLNLEVTAVEPSVEMIRQRTSKHPVVQATAEELPFKDNEFDASLAILTLHHWQDSLQGLKEMRRVSKRQVVFTFDPELQDSLWLIKDYLPESISFEKDRAISIETVSKALEPATVNKVYIPWDCTDGFLAAYWKRPEAYLNPQARQAISTFAQLPKSLVNEAMHQLEEDLRSGAWKKKNSNLLSKESEDFGYRLICSD